MIAVHALPRLMLVTDRRRTGGRSLVSLVAEVARAGCRLIQIREKDLDEGQLERLALSIRERVGPEVLLLLNGRPGIAASIGTGLHLPAGAAAARAPAGFPTGRSVHDADETKRAVDERVDYLVFGNVWATASKPGLAGQGVAALRRMRELAGGRPVYAIGGLRLGRVAPVLRAGAFGIAVCGALLEARDPGAVASELLVALGA